MTTQLDLPTTAASDLSNGPFIGDHRKKMEALLRHFHRGGISLATCADAKHLGRKVSTLKPYVRRLKLAFPDYVPLALRPKKTKAEKRRRAAR